MPHLFRRKRRDPKPRTDGGTGGVAEGQQRTPARRTSLADVYRRIDEDQEER